MRLKIPDNWMMELLQNHNVDIRVFGCMPYQSRGGRGLVRLSSYENMEVILNKIRSRKEVVRASFSRESDHAIIGEVVIERCAACMALRQSDCFMVSSKSKGGWLEWSIAGESNSAIHDLIYLLGKNKCEIQLTRISGSSGASGLTLRQGEILQFAYSSGYYEYPRKIRLRDLSRIFDVSPSTMSEILRAGQRRIFSEYFGLPSV
ncbi:MAG TPA: helix-turn-helix domain-containing protein [Candidatus Methanoperedens sp.]